jgi:hypothetical protein
MTTYSESDFLHFTRLPDAVYVALGRGDITFLQFVILAFWHRKADRYAGVVTSFRAEMVLDWLADMDCSLLNNQRLPSLRTTRRHVRGLWEAGWCHSGYRQGNKKPYDVTLCNFCPGAKARKDELGSTFSHSTDKGLLAGSGAGHLEGSDSKLLNPSTIKPWKETSTYQGRYSSRYEGTEESDSEDREKATNTQIAGHAFGVGQENLPASQKAGVESTEVAVNLMKALSLVASQVLHNTRSVPRNLEFKFELMAVAYGANAVVLDFEEWCWEHIENKFPHPITEYLKVIDSRLGSAPVEKQADLKNPQVSELRALSYELTGMLPHLKPIAVLLLDYPFGEIKAALIEYTDSLTEAEVKGCMRRFYSQGGAGAIILARRRRNEKAHGLSVSVSATPAPRT